MNSEFTDDTILGGSIIIKQPKSGFRISSDSVFAAAAVPVKNEENVLDVGAGTGAISLVLAKRYTKSKIYAVENFPLHIQLLTKNILLNKLSDQITAIDSDISNMNLILLNKKFDHIVTNPPFYPKNKSQLPANLSNKIFSRSGKIKELKAYCPKTKFLF